MCVCVCVCVCVYVCVCVCVCVCVYVYIFIFIYSTVILKITTNILVVQIISISYYRATTKIAT